MSMYQLSERNKKRALNAIRRYFYDTRPEEMKILVFKTSLKHRQDVVRIMPGLEYALNIAEWSLDNEDSDNVLRIVGKNIEAHTIIKIIKSKGYECEVLP